ncbi:MAG TPA: NUDIX domain-containing protein [Candidatus Competibacteraceae bacterium]|nr:MAG: NUDIX domain-containing protein [Candidatus Competibacteraceae bacterium]HOB61031.1 NUDIX domain-containing protein [Candidatus Competibacteraceae bacterium]HQA25817.1 NUDIX domain-containing protein [Candidatus Competibacteraceae bacterium]HQD55832.1 NUDIX domain-containing protein [Candidatus Competibacteraceae bacterium]
MKITPVKPDAAESPPQPNALPGERAAFSVDLVIFTIRSQRLQVLLVKRADPPFVGCWALPGGFLDVEMDESIESCALRRLVEKTGVHAPYLEQLKTYGSRERDPRGWTATTVYFALMASDPAAPGKQREAVRWMPVQGDGVNCELAFDHAGILADAVERLRSKLEYTHIAVHLLPEEFTLPELQRTYEIILQQPLDKSSFRRRVTQADMLEEVAGKLRDGCGRPAQVYRFRDYDRRTFFPRSISRYAR